MEIMLSLGVGVLCALVSFFLVKFAAKRSAKQPLNVITTQEKDIVASAASNPKALGVLWVLEGKEFEDARLGSVWDKLKSRAVEQGHSEPETSKEAQAAEHWESVSDTLTNDERNLFQDGEVVTNTRMLMKRGYFILDAVADRGTHMGVGVIEKGKPGEKAWMRRATPVTRTRLIFGAVSSFVLGTGAGLLSFSTASAVPGLQVYGPGEMVWRGGMEAWFGLLAMLVVVLAGVVLTFVDYDTMYIDVPILGVATLLGVGFAVLSAWSAGDLERLWYLAPAAVVAVALEVIGAIYKKIRGKSGWGFGDTLLIFLFFGVPSLVAGAWMLGVWGIAIAGLGFAGGYIVLSRKDKTANEKTPMAFGPYLIMAWLPTWLLWTQFGGGF